MTFPINYTLDAVKGVDESFNDGVRSISEMFMDLGLVNVKTTSVHTETFNSREGFSAAKQLATFETPPTGSLEQGFQVTMTPNRYGAAIEIPEETYTVISKDNTVTVDEYIEEQRNQLLNDVYFLMARDYHSFFNDAFTGASVLCPDGLSVANSAHLWNTAGAATWDNSVTAALSSTAIDSMEQYGGAFLDPSGKNKPISFDTIVVKKGSEASRTAKRLFYSNINATAVSDVNIYEGGAYRVVESPFLDSQTAWFGMALNGQHPNPFYLGINAMPKIHEPTVEKNRAINAPCTGFWKTGVKKQPVNVYCSTGLA